jgi:hypothetical protein
MFVSDNTFNVEKIVAPLYGIESLESPITCPVRIEHGIWQPPSYMVRLTLAMAKFTLGWPDEKITWSSFMRFKGVGFEVRDWKRSTWTIETEAEDECTLEVGAELKKKICSACEILDSQLASLRMEEVSEGKFFLDNTYLKVRNLYEHFKEQMFKKVEMDSLSEGTSLGVMMNTALNEMKVRSYNGCAASAFYYSAIDTLLDIAYALGSQTIDFKEFRAMTWRQRMSHVLPIGSDPELRRIHERLIRIKREVRDRVLHGLGGDERILLPTPGLGLLPVSYKLLDSMNMFGWVPFSDEALSDIPDVFDEFDEWLRTNNPWRNYLLLAESMLPIPLFGKRREEILNALGDDFEDWIHEQQEYEDYWLNHWE